MMPDLKAEIIGHKIAAARAQFAHAEMVFKDVLNTCQTPFKRLMRSK